MANWTTGLFRRASSRRAAVPETVEIGGTAVPLRLREHATARRIVMRVSPCGRELRLTVPRRTSAAAVLAFLDRHRDWAESRLSPGGRRPVLGDGATIPFRGEPLTIRAEPGRRQTVHLEGDGILLVGGGPEHLARRVRDFVQRSARADLAAAVERHAKAAGVRPAGIALRDTISRWGSCSTTRRLSFSWRVVLAPPEVLDYLAAHEVAHLAHMNHGPEFWALCERLCPGMEAARSWLKRHGGGLHAIDFG